MKITDNISINFFKKETVFKKSFETLYEEYNDRVKEINQHFSQIIVHALIFCLQTFSDEDIQRSKVLNSFSIKILQEEKFKFISIYDSIWFSKEKQEHHYRLLRFQDDKFKSCLIYVPLAYLQLNKEAIILDIKSKLGTWEY